jgi:hypothetical protein
MDEKKDNLRERLGAVAALFLSCYDVNSAVTRLNVLKDFASGETKKLLHDMVLMLTQFGAEVNKE